MINLILWALFWLLIFITAIAIVAIARASGNYHEAERRKELEEMEKTRNDKCRY